MYTVSQRIVAKCEPVVSRSAKNTSHTCQCIDDTAVVLASVEHNATHKESVAIKGDLN